VTSAHGGHGKRLDAEGLRTLAHPLRVRLLNALRFDGPSTATRLAQQLGEDSGNVSWHLRQLSEHGFVAEDVDRGTRRERWWHVPADRLPVDINAVTDETDIRDLPHFMVSEVLREQFRRAANFLAQNWPIEWHEAAGLGYWKLRLRSAELISLRDDLRALMDRYHAVAGETDEDGDGENEIVFQFQAFPRQGEL
jgi:DNA-binding transcriptional ArsR family regulator